MHQKYEVFLLLVVSGWVDLDRRRDRKEEAKNILCPIFKDQEEAKYDDDDVDFLSWLRKCNLSYIFCPRQLFILLTHSP